MVNAKAADERFRKNIKEAKSEEKAAKENTLKE